MDKNNNKVLQKDNTFLVDYFDDINLNEELKKIYEIINDDELNDEFIENNKLTELRNKNYKNYLNLKVENLDKLPQDFKSIKEDILKYYNMLNLDGLLVANLKKSKEYESIIKIIEDKLFKLDVVISSRLDETNKKNDELQKSISLENIKKLDIDEKLKKEIIEKYNDLVLFNSDMSLDNYEELLRQVRRTDYINEILNMLNKKDYDVEQTQLDKVSFFDEHDFNIEDTIDFSDLVSEIKNSANQSDVLKQNIESNKNNLVLEKDCDLKLDDLNKKIEDKINLQREQIYYLEDLMIKNSEYEENINSFINSYNNIIEYNKNDYASAFKVYEELYNDSKLDKLFSYYEKKLIEERSKYKKEEEFVYKKVGVKNLKNSLNYISANYMDILSIEDKKIIEKIYNELALENYDINNLENELNIIVKKIWKETITNVYSYNPMEDYSFICSNNQFIDAKYQTILITKKELERVNDYSNYQIGYICSFNDNILYITENYDIMEAEYDDMSKLKTPVQIEQELIKFGVKNRIALNGYKTNIEAVYLINDGNIDKYMKALELANTYKLPLIELKKDN